VVAPPPLLDPAGRREASVSDEEDGQDEEPAPVNHHLETRAHHWPLFGAGTGIAGAAYLGSAIAGATTSNGYLAIPLAGPFVGLFGTTNRAAVALLSIDGALQLGGLAMTIAGPFLHRTVRVPDRAPTPPRPRAGLAGRLASLTRPAPAAVAR
jgi:hypothetical protein